MFRMKKLNYIPLVLLSLILVSCASTGNPTEKVYNGLFDAGRVHEIDIDIKEEDWQDLLANPVDKTKYEVSVTVDGEKFEHVGMSTTGNASLTHVATTDSDRYSFKINFTKYDEGRTYHGLDKLKLANLYHDQSCMRDYLSYRIIAEAGGYAPLASYVWLRINGEDYGLYLCVEEIDEGYLGRTQDGEGFLYKPEPEWMDQSKKVPDTLSDTASIMERFENRREYFGSTDSGADLVYTDDRPESYNAIFDEAVNDPAEEDEIRLLGILRKLNSREDLPSVLNTSEIIGYFAGHNFTLSYDSYMALPVHNYCILERNGVLSVVAWDYNDAFGQLLSRAYPQMTEDEIISWDIDSPLFGVAIQDRPLWSWIAESPGYLEEYHAAMNALLENYLESGRAQEELGRVHGLIGPYVAKDPTAFFTVGEFEEGFSDLVDFCLKRTETVRSQLSETI